MTQILQVADQYQELLNSIDGLIKKSLYKVRAIIDALDMADTTFYEKRKRKTWTVQELKTMAPMLAKQTA